MLKVTTTLKHDDKTGAAYILARSGGKQKRTPLDYGQGNDRNHGAAAGNLLVKLGHGADTAALPMTRENNDAYTRYTFVIG